MATAMQQKKGCIALDATLHNTHGKPRESTENHMIQDGHTRLPEVLIDSASAGGMDVSSRRSLNDFHIKPSKNTYLCFPSAVTPFAGFIACLLPRLLISLQPLSTL